MPENRDNFNTPQSETIIHQEKNNSEIKQIESKLKSESTTPPESIKNDFISFKEALGYNDQKDNIFQQIENFTQKRETVKSNNYTYTGTPTENLQILKNRQKSFKDQIGSLSPLKKISKNIEKLQVVYELKKHGLKKADQIVKAMEKYGFPTIFHEDNKNTEVRYKNLLSYPTIYYLDKLASKNLDKDNFDIFRKISILNSRGLDPLSEGLNQDEDLLSLSPKDFDSYMFSIGSKYNHFDLKVCNYFLDKTNNSNFTQEDSRKIDIYYTTKTNIFLSRVFPINLNQELSKIEESYRAYTSLDFYKYKVRHGSGTDYDFDVGISKFLKSDKLFGNNESDNNTIIKTLQLPVDITKFYNFYHSFFSNYSSLKADFDGFKKCCFQINKEINSSNGDYLKTVIEFLNYPDIKTVNFIAKNLNFIKTPNGINLLKSLKDKTSHDYIKIANAVIDNKLETDRDFFENFYSGVLNNFDQEEIVSISKKIIKSSSMENKELLINILNIPNFNIVKTLITNPDKINRFYINNQLTKDFFIFFSQDQEDFSQYFSKFSTKKDWETAFGKEILNSLLNVLPTKTDEKRNAFTRNEYDRTSAFFSFLIDHPESKFVLDKDNLLIAIDYIKSFGLSKTPILFQYFKDITELNQGKDVNLSEEFINSKITTIDQLKNQINDIRQLCLSNQSLVNISNLSPLQLNLLSSATGHSTNRWTRQPIENIINDFTKDLSEGNIFPLLPEFSPSSTNVDKMEIKNTVDLVNNQIFQTFKKEILSSISNVNQINDLKYLIIEIINQKIKELSEKENNIFISKQIDTFRLGNQQINKTVSIDEMIESLLSLNINFGQEQDHYNSVLRQLVFRKVLNKHNSPDFIEDLRISLENNQGPSSISNGWNFLNNLVKDHALDFETNNSENYWDKKSFANIKKYGKVFKKNLNIVSFTKELGSISDRFEILKSESNLKIDMIPDRGLIGEMSGYMADVCYTRVYPLLKQYPNLIPYKFVDSSVNNNSELIGSTLVFQVETKNGDPALLIRAFDIPKEQTLDIGQFFEKFVDSLSESAKKLGVKKIIAAGSSGTISNYPLTTKYVVSNYIKDKEVIPLKDKFNFNGYDITNQCYLVRDLD
ncbi:MAG: hypothetical protein WCX20_00790 [Candidatus Shapirobacteria bacterium]